MAVTIEIHPPPVKDTMISILQGANSYSLCKYHGVPIWGEWLIIGTATCLNVRIQFLSYTSTKHFFYC